MLVEDVYHHCRVRHPILGGDDYSSKSPNGGIRSFWSVFLLFGALIPFYILIC